MFRAMSFATQEPFHERLSGLYLEIARSGKIWLQLANHYYEPGDTKVIEYTFGH